MKTWGVTCPRCPPPPHLPGSYAYVNYWLCAASVTGALYCLMCEAGSVNLLDNVTVNGVTWSSKLAAAALVPNRHSCTPTISELATDTLQADVPEEHCKYAKLTETWRLLRRIAKFNSNNAQRRCNSPLKNDLRTDLESNQSNSVTFDWSLVSAHAPCHTLCVLRPLLRAC